jgi:myosin heavy subunit|eukprot:COSAG01_NODE_1535_length_9988_cov_30.249065_4_plen_285_part_00
MSTLTSTCMSIAPQSRVVAKMGQGERNYHIFYQLAYLPAEDKEQLKYAGPEYFMYAMKCGCTVVDSLDDQSDFQEVLRALDTFGVTGEERVALYRVVVGVLYLGNVEFEAGEDGNASVSNDETLDPIGELFQTEAEILETTLTMRTMASAGRSIVVIPLTVDKAVEAQEGLAKGTYSRLFDYVVERLNEVTAPPGGFQNSIGVLDIFGFEIFELNSFEQLCINLANEKLQMHFNEFIFQQELQIYKKEGLDITGIAYADNQPCLDMLEKVCPCLQIHYGARRQR